MTAARTAATPTTAPASDPPRTPSGASQGVGQCAPRPDGIPKVRGEFAFSSDLHHDEMLWGATVRSQHPHAAIGRIDSSAALALPGVVAVLTAADVPGRNRHGLERRDQPVLAGDLVRYVGEPVALVAADHPETARRAASMVSVSYTPLPTVTDPEGALRGDGPRLHEGGNTIRHLRIRRGTPARDDADVVVTGEYEVGMQDQAFLGPESCLALPTIDGGVDLHCSTQWLHIDQDQLADCLAMPKEKVRLILAGVGGAFGGREDLSVQAHACLLALRTGRPVKMMYGREESFAGHVHRHPARMRYEHGATRDGRLLYVKARILLDGGAYASTSAAVVGNAGCFAAGPYEVDAVEIDCYAVYTNNPPCGAMRGFGAVQVCFGYESQMDKLARQLRIDPVELRARNAVSPGSVMATGQRVNGPAPVAKLLRRVADVPLPPADRGSDVTLLPGGAGNVTRGEGVRRGVGFGVSVKNICKSAGYDDFATARVRVARADGDVHAYVRTAAAEVGQGLVTVQAQVVRTELGIENVTVLPADTTVGDAGTSSASRQTWMSGGAVQAACGKVRQRLLRMAAQLFDEPHTALRLHDGHLVSTASDRIAPIAEIIGNRPVDETAVFRHRPTQPLDPETGQGDAHVAYAFAAHRAVVDVDTELGLVSVVEIACAEDVGKAINPSAVEGQMHGAIAQGVGLALMEELIVEDGRIRNPSFTDYLIPTTLDMPPTRLDILELPRSDSPYGLTGVGEPALLSTPAAIVSAIRDATGADLHRIPVRPDSICGIPPRPAQTFDHT